MMVKKLGGITVLVVFLVLLGLIIPAQATYTVWGQVVDTDGTTALNGVDVTVTDLNTSDSISTTTAGGGYYQVIFGPPGTPNEVKVGDPLHFNATYGSKKNTTIVTATGSGQVVNLILQEDSTPPVTTVTGITPEPTNYGWNNATPVTVSFSRTDPNSTGVDYTNYSTTSDAGPWTTEDGEDPFDVIVSTEGTTTIWYYSVDNAGNIEATKSVDVKIDLTAPTVIFIDPTPANESVNTTGYVNVTVEVTDPSPGSESEDVVYLKVWNATGLYRVINESAGGYQGFAVLYASVEHNYSYNLSAPDGSPLPDGEYTYQAFAKDLAGNTGSSETRVVTVSTVTEYNFTIDFAAGYNMITIPVNDTSVTNASTLMDKIGANCQEILKWDKATQQWKSYITGMPSVFDFDIEGGEGCFVRMSSPATVIFMGAGWESPFTISLVTGYDMIGIPVNDTSVTNASTLMDKIGANCQEILKWDKATQAWKSYISGMPSIFDFDIEGGEGSFVRMAAPADVEFVGAPWSD